MPTLLLCFIHFVLIISTGVLICLAPAAFAQRLDAADTVGVVAGLASVSAMLVGVVIGVMWRVVLKGLRVPTACRVSRILTRASAPRTVRLSVVMDMDDAAVPENASVSPVTVECGATKLPQAVRQDFLAQSAWHASKTCTRAYVILVVLSALAITMDDVRDQESVSVSKAGPGVPAMSRREPSMTAGLLCVDFCNWTCQNSKLK